MPSRLFSYLLSPTRTPILNSIKTMSVSDPRHVARRQSSRHVNNAFHGGIAMALLGAQMEWVRRVQWTVPEPYLDEFFHIPQADAYWQGKWSQWDEKITTPPGLYVWSIFVSKIFLFNTQSNRLTPYQLRMTSLAALYLLTLSCALWMRLGGKAPRSGGRLPLLLTIQVFPLLFFLSGIYYTDVFSAFTVILTYALWQAGLLQEGRTKIVFQLLHFVCGLTALAARQTNIFWVAVFIGGLQAVHTIKEQIRVHDPPVADAYFEGTWVAPSGYIDNLTKYVRLPYHNHLPLGFRFQCTTRARARSLAAYRPACFFCSFCCLERRGRAWR